VKVVKRLRFEYFAVCSDNAHDLTTSVAHANCRQQTSGFCPLYVNNIEIFQWNVDREIKKDAMSWTCSNIKKECSNWKTMRRQVKLLNTRRYEGRFLDCIPLRTEE